MEETASIEVIKSMEETASIEVIKSMEEIKHRKEVKHMSEIKIRKEVVTTTDAIEYIFHNETGDAHMMVYYLFPGVEVAYISVHMEDFDFALMEQQERHKYVSIHFCKEGRMEQEMDKEFFYMMPEDCWIVLQDEREKKFKLPLKHYHGISIGIDLEKAPRKFTEYIGNDQADPWKVARRLCQGKGSVILRSVEPLKHIFSESYEVSEDHRVDYLKIKLLELLFMLGQMTVSASGQEDYSVPRMQAELVKKVAAYISGHLHDKLELKTLTARFGVSDTYLQKSFHAVYGMPVAAFIRAQKMQKAAQVLIHTDRSIDDVAAEFGYMNESKFSAVFKKLMGDSPSVFRKEHSQIRIL